jgi:UDP-N-acetylglucosamine diphosphorylase / glucose-1-phosphate thymidylyltransferase / UDP-N-acetylgalactosamine diphosphorylase / glucosamine-1-phosphate N-acetyltransferase / galactosamine-1-phosphate N-acetyltransferase
VKAVLLAAGEGVRLLPITATRPKHLIQIDSKPLLQHSLEALKANGVTQALIITHYMGEAIRSHFGDGEKLGLKLTYADQEEVLGTGNAAGLAENYIDGDFLLVYGDLMFSANVIETILGVHKKEKSEAVIAVVPTETPEKYGIIELKKDGTVKRIVEKPKRKMSPSNLANAGIYVFGKGIFEALRRVKRSPRGEWELTDAVSLLAADGKVAAAEISKDDWFDIGRPWELLDANAWALRRIEHRVLGNIEEGAHLLGPVTVAETARVRSGAYIEGPCFIDEGADIGPNCFIRACTSIGKNARVGNGCEIKNSIIMDGTHVGHLSYVGDSILCEKCNLGAGTIMANLRLDDGTVKVAVKGDVVDTGRRKLGGVLGDNVKTGVGALLMPGVKVGNDCWVGAGFIVERDLPANSIAYLQQSWEMIQKKP